MKWLDSLFQEIGNPIPLLDMVIGSGQLCDWLEAHQENTEEKTMWEYYLYKLGAFDERSFDDFKNEVKKNVPNKANIHASDEQLTATVKKSFDTMKDFKI